MHRELFKFLILLFNGWKSSESKKVKVKAYALQLKLQLDKMQYMFDVIHLTNTNNYLEMKKYIIHT